MLPPVVVVAQGAGEVELALAAIEGFPAGFEERPGTRVDCRLDRKPPRLARDIGGEREQLLALVGERRRFLPLGAAGVDALLEVHRPAAGGIESGVARRDALHARAGVSMAAGTREAGGAGLRLPQRLAVEHPQRARVGRVVVLDGARLARHELVARTALFRRNLGGGRRSAGELEKEAGGREGQGTHAGARAHSTRIEAISVTV